MRTRHDLLLLVLDLFFGDAFLDACYMGPHPFCRASRITDYHRRVVVVMS